MASKKLVVFGGSGFLGSRICKAAVSRGWTVTSVSRSGEPSWNAVTSSADRPTWASSVNWDKADVFKPTTYHESLKDAKAVVHSMGILLEADYKNVLSGKESIIAGLQRAFSQPKATRSPLERNIGGDIPTTNNQLTYEAMNRDSAVALAQEAEAIGATTFGYISAAAGFPLLPQRYINTKREAESLIANNFPKLRSLFFRPGFLHDPSRAFTGPVAALTSVAATVNDATGKNLTWLMGAGGTRPSPADLVAQAVIEAFEDDAVKGVVDVDQMEKLAHKSWRRDML